MPTFSEYLLENLQGLERQQGHRVTLDVFATYLGVKRPILSLWMSGKARPSFDSVRVIAEKLGPEIYDILEFPRPDPDLQALTRIWPYLSEEARRTLRAQGEKFADENKQSSGQTRPAQKAV